MGQQDLLGLGLGHFVTVYHEDAGYGHPPFQRPQVGLVKVHQRAACVPADRERIHRFKPLQRYIGALGSFQVVFGFIERHVALLEQQDGTLDPAQNFLGLDLAFRIVNLRNGKGDFMSLVILAGQLAAGVIQVFPQQVSGQREQQSDTEDAVGRLRVVQHQVKEDSQSRTGQKLDEYRHVLNFFA